MDHGLQCKRKKFLGQNIGEKLWDRGLGKEFLDKEKAQFIKGKFDKLKVIKIKNFCSAKDPVNRIKKDTGRKYLQSTYLKKN